MTKTNAYGDVVESPKKGSATRARRQSSGTTPSYAPRRTRGTSSVEDLLVQQQEERFKLLHSDIVRVVERLKAQSWQLFSAGMITPPTYNKIRSHLDNQADVVDSNIVFLTPADIASHASFKIANRRSVLIRCTSRALSTLAKGFDTCLCSLPARVIWRLSARIQMLELSRVYDVELGYYLLIEALLEEFDHGTAFSIDPENNTLLADAMRQHLADAMEAISDFRKANAHLTQCMNTLKAARLVLNKGIKQVDDLLHHGTLAETEAERLSHQLKIRATKLFFDAGKALEFIENKLERERADLKASGRPTTRRQSLTSTDLLSKGAIDDASSTVYQGIEISHVASQDEVFSSLPPSDESPPHQSLIGDQDTSPYDAQRKWIEPIEAAAGVGVSRARRVSKEQMAAEQMETAAEQLADPAVAASGGRRTPRVSKEQHTDTES